MRVASRVSWPIACAVAILAISAASADLIFLKDGFVVQGKVRREVTAELDPVSKDMILIPKGFYMLDDGPRRIYFSPSQVRIVEKLAAPAEERVISRSDRMIVNPRIPPPHLEVVEVGPWNLAKWERSYAFRSPDAARVGVTQAIATLSPYYARVDAVTKFRWSSAYLTREWPADEVLALLEGKPDLQENAKDPPAVVVAKRFRICDFLAQAGWFAHAQKKLDTIQKDFPDQKDRIVNAQTLLDQLRARDDWEQIKNWYQAARYEGVRRQLANFSSKGASDRILADLREMKSRLVETNEQLQSARALLAETAQEATTPEGRTLTEACNVLREELHPANVGRLEAFLGQARNVARERARGKKPSLRAEQLLALAVSGWLLGSPSAEVGVEHAVNLWKTREMVLRYLREPEGRGRKRVLDDYLARVTPRVDLDEVAQLIDSLPPAEPALDTTSDAVEVRTRGGRQAADYLLKLPPEYTHNRQYPVLILLHNLGEKPRTILDRFAEAAAERGYILAAPKWVLGLNDDYGYTANEHQAVLQTLRDLRQRFQVDNDRVFLFGVGEGGRMAYDVGLSHPDNFAGLLPMGAGPNFFPKRYWRNAQYLPVYAVNGTRGADSQTLLRDQFEHWVSRGFPALWVEYKGRGTEFFSAEVPAMFDWMRHQKRTFPLKQLGVDGSGGAFGTEFCTMRPEDDRFYWLSTTGVSPRNTLAPGKWNNMVQPAAMTGRIDPTTNEITLRTQGLNNVSVWLGRNTAGQYMIDFEKPVTVLVGLRAYWTNRKVVPSLEVLLDDLHRRGDRKHLFLARIDITIR